MSMYFVKMCGMYSDIIVSKILQSFFVLALLKHITRIQVWIDLPHNIDENLAFHYL